MKTLLLILLLSSCSVYNITIECECEETDKHIPNDIDPGFYHPYYFENGLILDTAQQNWIKHIYEINAVKKYP